MYEIFVLIPFIVIFLLEKMRTMQTVVFISITTVYILYDIGAVDALTLKLSALVTWLVSSMFIMASVQYESRIGRRMI